MGDSLGDEESEEDGISMDEDNERIADDEMIEI
jgi:hypothetical protein